MSNNLQSVQEIIDSPVLRAKPRAILLLKLCRLSRLLLPEFFNDYWERLQSLNKHLPSDYKKDYNSIKAALEPQVQSHKKGFVAEIISQINATAEKTEANKQEAIETLKECERQLNKKWWRSGKAPAWLALIEAWVLVDRKNSIRLTKKTNRDVQRDLLMNWNEESPLSSEEWELAYEIIGQWDGVDTMVEEILAQSDAKVFLPEKLVTKVASNLRSKITDHDDEIDEKKQKEALNSYIKLVQNVGRDELDSAISLMIKLFSSVATNDKLFSNDFIKGFTLLGSIITRWTNMKDHHKEAASYLAEHTPSFLRDFALAQWYALAPETSKQAEQTYKEMLRKVSSAQHSEGWFFILLVERGFHETALQLVNSSKNKEKLLSNIQRALVCQSPEQASKNFDIPNAKVDPIGHFIMLSSVEDWVKFLRDSTNKGSTSLSTTFWTKPNITDALGDRERDSLYNYYMKGAKKNEQFEVFLRVHGYQFYSHENLDPYLLAALIHWDDKHAEEVSSVLGHLWNVMKPSDLDLQVDIIRNSIFERCRNVFGAHPESLYDFIKWIKKKLVDNSYQYQIGDMLYTLSLKNETLFLFCILAAQKVADFSAKRCDEILIHAMKSYVSTYEMNKDLVHAAAELFASDKGLKAINEKMDLAGSITDAWQTGIIEACVPIIVNEMIETKKAAID